MRHVLFAVATVVTFACNAAPLSDEKQILRLEDEWVKALETRDRQRLNEIVARDFTFIEPDGTVKTREQYLADRSSDIADIESFSNSDLRVRIYGTSALATGVAHITERRAGNRYRFSLRWKELWLKEAGRWQVLAAQATPVNAAWDKPFIVGE